MNTTLPAAPATQTIPTAKNSTPEQLFIIEAVLAQLGRPGNLARVDAKLLWGANYRVNIYCTMDSDRPISTVEMTDSFFVTLNDQQVEADPAIVRRYSRETLN